MPPRRGTTGSTQTPDDRKDRRTVIVPDELWKHVEEWGKKTGRKDTSVVRICIQHMVDRLDFLKEVRNELDIFKLHSRMTWLKINALMEKDIDKMDAEELRAHYRTCAKAIDKERVAALIEIERIDKHKLFSDPFGS